MKLALFVHLLAAGIWVSCLLVAFIRDEDPLTVGPIFRDEINRTLLLPALVSMLLSGGYMAAYSPYLLSRLFVAKMVFAQPVPIRGTDWSSAGSRGVSGCL